MQRRWDLQQSSKSSSHTSPDADQNIFERAGAAHRGEGEEVKIDVETLSLRPYEAGVSRGNELFSKTSPKALFALLAEFAFSQGQPNFSKKYFKLKTECRAEDKPYVCF